jgi:hypothetical protein
MGRTAHSNLRSAVDDAAMDDSGSLHHIEDDLAANWLEEWTERGVQAIERYLAKHLAFETFLDETA